LNAEPVLVIPAKEYAAEVSLAPGKNRVVSKAAAGVHRGMGRERLNAKPSLVIPAKAGIHFAPVKRPMDSR
jgi:hypothetical protein